MLLDQPARASKPATPAARFGLIADDLTGACDAGVKFAQHGFSTLVRLAAAEEIGAAEDLAIIVTHSRKDPPETARAKIQRACQRFHQEGRGILYQKIDSTLRGNLGVEITAALEFSGASLAIVAPAFPAQGRTLEGGWLRVGGGASGRIHLPTLLRDQGIAHVAHIARQCPAGGPQAVTARMEEAARESAVVVVDAATPEDLELIAQAAMDCRARVLAVGSAGLAGAIARLMAIRYRRPAPPPRPTEAAGEPGLVALVLGSTTPVTAEQATQFMVTHRSGVFDLPTTNLWPIRRALRENRHITLHVAFRGELRRCLTRCLKVFKDYALRGVILSGGDTAALVCRAWEMAGIRLECEIAPGIPWGRVVGGPANGLPIATKAGGFGDRNALAVMAEFLARQQKAFL